jgi:predicted transcriptional regulator
MLKGKIEILSSIALNKCKMEQLIGGRITRDNLYIASTVNSLIEHGFIQNNNPGEYRLTLEGIRALLKFGNDREISRKVLRSELFHQYLDESYIS